MKISINLTKNNPFAMTVKYKVVAKGQPIFREAETIHFPVNR